MQSSQATKQASKPAAAAVPVRTTKGRSTRQVNKPYARKAQSHSTTNRGDRRKGDSPLPSKPGPSKLTNWTTPADRRPPPAPSSGSSTRFSSVRPLYEHIAAKRYPHLTWRHNYDLQQLGCGIYDTKRHGESQTEFYAWSDKRMSREASRYGGDDEAMAIVMSQSSGCLNEPAQVIGWKPIDGDTEDMYIRPIPNSEFSIRIFGKYMENSRRYGLDFVRSSTGEPENSPFQYELWAVKDQDSEIPWVLSLPATRLRSTEEGMGQKSALRPGEERFLLPEGQACLFKRKGHRDVYFKVPVRPKRTMRVKYDADILDFSGPN